MIAYVQTYFRSWRDAFLLTVMLVLATKGFLFSCRMAGFPISSVFSPIWFGFPVFLNGKIRFGSWSPKHWVMPVNVVELPIDGRFSYEKTSQWEFGRHGGDILPWFAVAPGRPSQRDRLLADIKVWIGSHVKGRWRHVNNVFMFSRPLEAVHFKLRWFDVNVAEYIDD